MTAWLSTDESYIYAKCVDDRPMRYSRICTEFLTSRHPNKCNEDGTCMLSWPSEDPAKWKSEELACRTVPTSYEDESIMEFVEAECAATEGFCPNCGVD